MLLRQAGLSSARVLNRSATRSPLINPRIPHTSSPYLAIRASFSNGRPSTTHTGTQLPTSLALHSRIKWRLQRPFLPRYASTRPLPAPQSRFLRYCYRGLAAFGLFVAISGGLVVAFFIYDASTYKEGPSIEEDIPVSEVALHPRRGGPKNLPIAEHLVDDDDSAA